MRSIGFDLEPFVKQGLLQYQATRPTNEGLESHLARIELNVLFEEWLKRMPNVRHDPAKPSTYRAALILALATLPLVWDPA